MAQQQNPMPEPAPEELTQLFAESPPKLVAITGYGDNVDRRRSSESGFAHHLVKPVDLDELALLIEQA